MIYEISLVINLYLALLVSIEIYYVSEFTMTETEKKN